ncbi:hypothetical protein E0Z10_g9598 [Xylaria hypoxylon]|uniref:UbiA prenyltransferase n=1 Tax=Xylaria hypoxylon TaxID=37992 RepID=A0A4Z0Y851_9PEZI|nr:hypothetical protein E0Z10_g9598 [Xylaria hypoxylon]
MISGQFTASHWQIEPQMALPTRLLRVVLWIWLQLLVLDLANQRLPDSIAEDIINKPWRPITSDRITAEGARRLLIASIAITLAASSYLGVTSETLLLFMFNWMYNDLGLANSHWLLRNLMNALGITTIGAGATRVACGDLAFMTVPATRWWLLCGGMLMTTIHAQDMYDQQGDAVRGRSTAPLVLGDGVARWTVGAGVLFWSVASEWIFSLNAFLLHPESPALPERSNSRPLVKDRYSGEFYNITNHLVPQCRFVSACTFVKTGLATLSLSYLAWLLQFAF